MGRWFTPSDSDNQSGEQYNAAYNAASTPAPVFSPAPNNAVANKRKKLSQTILTSPEGLLEDANVQKKTLLGM